MNGAPRAPLPTGGSNAAAIAIAVVAVGLFAVAILGIVAAIAIPNLLTAMQRSKQKRTMADMRVLAVTIEQQAQSGSERRYPATLDRPAKDGWTRDIRYVCWPADECTNYALISAGKDGRFETEDVESYQGGGTTDFDADIVMVNGEFFRSPDLSRGPAVRE